MVLNFGKLRQGSHVYVCDTLQYIAYRTRHPISVVQTAFFMLMGTIIATYNVLYMYIMLSACSCLKANVPSIML